MPYHMQEERNKRIMAEKKNRKEKSFMDKMTDIFIVLVIIAAIFFIVALVMEKNGEKKDKEKQDEKKVVKVTETPAQTPLPEGVVRYNNIISSEKNDTEFYLLFNYNDGTYQEMIRASSLEDSLDEGTFEEGAHTIKTISAVNDGLEENYIIDGEFIIPESAVFKGDIGDKDRFEADCVSESKDYTTTITFYREGNFREESISKTEGVEDVIRGGTYERKGKYIKRTSANGEILMDLYIYNNQVANAYYKKSE